MFLKDEPAMVIEKSLVVADLHIGITKEIFDSGISLPKQSKRFADKLNSLKKETQTNCLIVLGDLKHKVPGISWQEFKEIPEFINRLKYRNITIIKGNHDGWIEKIVKTMETKKKIEVKKSVTIKNFILTHGHRRIKASGKTIVIGHNHPYVKFIDELGARYYQPVWIKGPIKGKNELIIMPAFNDLSGMTIINEQKLLGPVAKLLNKKEAHVFLLDGTDLGVIESLRKNIKL